MLVCTRGTSENVDHRYAFRNLHLFKQEWQIWKCYCRYIAHQQFLRFMFGELHLLIFFQGGKRRVSHRYAQLFKKAQCPSATGHCTQTIGIGKYSFL